MWHDKHNIELFEADSALIFNKSPEKLNLSSSLFTSEPLAKVHSEG